MIRNTGCTKPIRMMIGFILIISQLAMIVVLITGCTSEKNEDNTIIFTSLEEIPGVTLECIRAIEVLRENHDFFTFGALSSIETFYDGRGNIRGFTALLCEWLTELFGINFIPIIVEWGDLLPEMQVDFTGELTATDERKNELGYYFTSAIGGRMTKYFRIAGSQPISEIKGIRPLNLAFMEGSTTSISAMAKLDATSVPFESFFVNDFESAYNLLESGRVDAFIHEMIVETAFDRFGGIVHEDFLPLIFEPVSLSTQNSQLEPIIDVVQKAILNGATDHLANLYEQGIHQHARYRLFQRLDDSELDFLRNNTEIAFLAEFDNYPLSFFNKNENQWQGVAFDILNEVTALTGLTFEPINESDVSFVDLMQMLENGEGAMITELLRSPPREGRFLWTENYVMLDNFVAISLDTMPNISINRVMQFRVGVQTGTAHYDLFKSWFPDHLYIELYDDVESAFEALENDDVDLLMFGMRHLLISTHYHERPGFKANIVFDYTIGSPFGFNINEEVLKSIVDKSLDMIDSEAIAETWLRKTFDYRLRIVQAQRPWLIGASVMFLVVVILVAVLLLRTKIASKMLEVLVKQRTEELNVSQQELQGALKSAREANKAKSSFLATMSHEIRTPMNAIIGISDIELDKDDHPAETMDAFNRIRNSGRILLSIINDILDLSKIESGKLELYPVKYDIASFINDTVRLNTMRIGDKPISFSVEISEFLPQFVLGDELRIKQVMNNILSNAIKYTDKGSVTFSIDAKYREDDVELIFEIRDTGQGMSEEQIDTLFDEYSMFNREANRTTEGTGLGMSITKKLVTMMNGEIVVNSQPGAGTIFRVSIAQELIGEKTLGREIKEKLENFKFTGRVQRTKLIREYMPYGSVLIVDDLDENLYVAKGLMKPYGLSVETALSGHEAIYKVQKGKTYDIIFMDFMMPGMDGIETTRQLRGMGYNKTIVALTANAVSGQKEVFFESGFDSFISKPIDRRKLNRILNEFIRDKQPTEVIEDAMRQNKSTNDDERVSLLAEHAIFIMNIQDISQLEVESALEAMNGSWEMYLETIRLMVKMLPDRIGRMDGFKNEDASAFAIEVHGLKSVLKSIGADEIGNRASILEKAALEDDKMFLEEHYPVFKERLSELLQSLISALKTIQPEIKGHADKSMLNQVVKDVKTALEEYDRDCALEVILPCLNFKFDNETDKLLEEIVYELEIFDCESALEKIILLEEIILDIP